MRTALAMIAVATAVAAGDAATTSDALRSAIAARVDAGRNTGIVAAVINADGSLATAAYGNAGPGAKPLDADSVFEIGSITKVFTATLLVDMVDRKEVALDDPIERYLPSTVHVPSRNGRKITLVDLATQSSALPRLPGNMKPAEITNPYADYSVEQMYAFLNGYTLTRDIGAQYEYSNLGVGLLGHVLALRAGQSYEQLIRERVLAPLRMNQTGITLTPWMTEHLARGHNLQGQPARNWDIPTLAGAGALRSTLNDMILFARANLDPSTTARLPRLMRQAHQARMATTIPDTSIGLAWHIRRRDGQDITWHNGGTGGYRTWIGFDAARRTAAVVLTNSTQGADDLGFELLAAK